MKTLQLKEKVNLNWYEWYIIFIALLFIFRYWNKAIVEDRIFDQAFNFRGFLLYNYLYNAIRISFIFLVISGISSLASVLLKLPVKFNQFFKATTIASMVYFFKYLLRGISFYTTLNYGKTDYMKEYIFYIKDIVGTENNSYISKVFVSYHTLYDIAFLIILAILIKQFGKIELNESIKIVGLTFLPAYFLYKIIIALIIYT